jgi:hypothetical protein
MSYSFHWTLCLTERADLSTTLIPFLRKKNTLRLQQICPLKNTLRLQQICPLVRRMSCSFHWTLCLTERADLSTTLIPFIENKNTLRLQKICPLLRKMFYSFHWTLCVTERADLSTTLIPFLEKKNTLWL